MNAEEFKRRTKAVGLRILNLVDELPRKPSSKVCIDQISRSGTSIGSNYRAACRARSRKEMAAKLGIVEEEADETLYWLELISEKSFVDKRRLAPLIKEVNEILSMVVASIVTLRGKQRT